MKITVSIYEKNTHGFLNQINKLSPYFSHFQIDISDGIYAPNRTVQIEEIINILKNLRSSIYDLTFDFHLMVENYQSEINKLTSLKSKLNIGNILIHYSLHPPIAYLLSLKYSWGLVLNSQDQVSDLINNYDLKKIPIIQIMTVQIGAQSNPFLSENIKKVEQLKNAGFLGKILIDGGISNKTLPLIQSQKYLPDVLCPGGFLTQATKEQLLERVSYLKKLCQN